MKRLFILICLVWFAGVCNASECLRFVIDDSDRYLQLEQEDVLKLSPNIDAEGNHIVELHLTNKGQLRVEKFTEKNIGEYVAIYLGKLKVFYSVLIMEPLKAASKIDMTAEDEYISDILMSCK
ncbi:MAG: hypothetical protein ACKE51_02405 [Methylococcaceae bacterium]